MVSTLLWGTCDCLLISVVYLPYFGLIIAMFWSGEDGMCHMNVRIKPKNGRTHEDTLGHGIQTLFTIQGSEDRWEMLLMNNDLVLLLTQHCTYIEVKWKLLTPYDCWE